MAMTKTKSRNKADTLKNNIKEEILRRDIFSDDVVPSEMETGTHQIFGIGIEEVGAVGVSSDEVCSAAREALKELFPETHKRIHFSIKFEDTISFYFSV